MAKTATLLDSLDGWAGDARLYRLSEPVAYGDEAQESTAHVVVSAVCPFFGAGPETYIFPSNQNGEVLSWIELTGSFKGGLDHRKALAGAGFVEEVPHA